MSKLIGREKELKNLADLLHAKSAQFLAIYGRMRLGKTFLISQFFQDKGIYFELTGIKGAKVQEQLRNFSEEFSDSFCNGEKISIPKSWQEAFNMMRRKIETIDPAKKVIIFLDELPWLASKRSGFLSVLDHTWNRYLSRHPNIILIVCGSSASWIIKKIVNDRGGFYGKLTAEIKLYPYTLKETELFLQNKGIELDQKQIIELYMAFGGIPKYLDYAKIGKSSAQIIQEACFTQNSPLSKEFLRIFSSLFDEAENHIAIVEALSTKNEGLTQKEILKITKLASGGEFTKILEELEESGFISYIPNYKKKSREGYYRLIDEYSLFYTTWIKPALKGRITPNENYWLQMQDSPTYRTWSGYSFEGVCLKHIDRIIKGLGISGVLTKATGWSYRPSDSLNDFGAQIDLVIERADHCTNLCEIKFSNTPFLVSKEYAKKLRIKKEIFRQQTSTTNSLFTTLITPYGAIENANYHEAVQNQLMMDIFFN